MLVIHIINSRIKSNSSKILLLLFSILISISLLAQKDNPLKKCVSFLSQYKSGMITLEYKTKPLFSTDTLFITQDLIFYLDDSLYNNLLFTHNSTNYLKYKDKYLYVIKKNGLVYRKENIGVTDTKLAPYMYYLSQGRTLKNLIESDKNNITFLRKEETDEALYYRYKIEIPNSKEISNGYIELLIKDSTYMLSQVTSHVEYMGKVQYNEINFKIESLYEDINTDIFDSIYHKYYLLQTLEISQKDTVAKLRKAHEEINLTVAPLWSLINVNNDTISFEDINSKLVLIDFWYISCAPCLKSIPTIVKFDSIYSDNVLKIIGINVFDRDTDKMKYIIDKFHVKYDIVYNGKKVAEKYNVKGYPELFLVDMKTNKIIYNHKGYSENMEIKIRYIIEQYLQSQAAN